MGMAISNPDVLAVDTTDPAEARQIAARDRPKVQSAVSTELRAPLAVIMGYVDLLRNRDRLTLTEEKQSECLEVVERNCHELLHLIEKFAFTETIEPGDLAVHRRGVDLGDLVGHCFDTWTAQAAAQGVELILVKGSPILLDADADTLTELFDQLFANAVGCTPAGERIEMKLSADETHAVIDLTNSGTYLAPDELERIFEPLFRGSNVPPAEGPESDVGLGIAKAIAEAHGGAVRVGSVRGIATQFCVTLPLVELGNG
jgi:signal transduction histidine kinase